MAENWPNRMDIFDGADFSFRSGMLFLFIDALFYLISYFYFDQILPNEFGTQKHPCFIFTFWKK